MIDCMHHAVNAGNAERRAIYRFNLKERRRKAHSILAQVQYVYRHFVRVELPLHLFPELNTNAITTGQAPAT